MIWQNLCSLDKVTEYSGFNTNVFLFAFYLYFLVEKSAQFSFPIRRLQTVVDVSTSNLLTFENWQKTKTKGGRRGLLVFFC